MSDICLSLAGFGMGMALKFLCLYNFVSHLQRMCYFYDWANRYVFFEESWFFRHGIPTEAGFVKTGFAQETPVNPVSPLNSSSLPNRPLRNLSAHTRAHTHLSAREWKIRCRLRVAPTESGFNRPKISCSERFHGIYFCWLPCHLL